MSKKFTLLILVLSFSLIFCCNVFAESDETDDQDDTLQLEKMTVTAEKRSQNIQDIPVSVSSFNEYKIRDHDVKEVSDVFNLVPNLSFSSQNQGVTYVSSRGISPNMINRRNPFVMFVDGVPYSNIIGYNADFNNVERVEVLRGPQGTLYGKNAMAGVMNVITKSPSNETEGRVSFDLSESETYFLQASVNGPILKDRLFMGISSSDYQTRGYMENDHPDEDYYDHRDIFKIRGRLRWVLSDLLEINLHSGKDVRTGGDGPMIGSPDIQYHEYKNPDDHVDVDNFDNALSAVFKEDKFQVSSITTYKKLTEDYDVDYSYGSSSVTHGRMDSEINTFSQEIRIQSRDEPRAFSWICGLYYETNEEQDQEMSMQYLPTPMMNFNRQTNWPTTTKGDTAAVFAQTTLPFWERFNLTAGLRYEYVEKEMDYHRETTNLDSGQVISTTDYTVEDDWNALTPKVSLDYRASDNLLFYGSFSQGYLAGGFNNTIDDPEGSKYDAQTNTSYELGTKTNWQNNRLSCNLSLFYMDIDDMQVTEYPNAYLMVASNAGKAHSYGAEIEAKYKPLRELTLFGAFGIIRGEYDEYMGYGGVDYSGNELKSTPQYSLNLGGQYRHSSGFYFGLDVAGYGKTYFNEDNGDTSERDPYTTVNAKAGMELTNWDFYVYAKNLFDEEYFSSIFTSGIRNSYMVGEPQRFGVNVVMRF
jgi:iron complex outermembrane receptor protein